MGTDYRAKAGGVEWKCAHISRLPVLNSAPVQLVYALNTALKHILESGSLEQRFQLHRDASNKMKDELTVMGFGFVPKTRELSANGMSAVRFPQGIVAADIVPKLVEKDIVVAGGLHKAIATEYFRIGHMGITATDAGRGDVERVIKGIKEVLEAKGWKKD